MKIKLARTKKEFTQKQLAEILGMSPSTINRIEVGKQDIRKLKLETLEKIAEALDATVQELFFNDDKED